MCIPVKGDMIAENEPRIKVQNNSNKVFFQITHAKMNSRKRET